MGRRVNGTLEQGWLYQDGLNPIAELDGMGQVVSRFVYGTRANVPDYVVKGGTTYRIVADELGGVRLVVDVSTGAVAHVNRSGMVGEDSVREERKRKGGGSEGGWSERGYSLGLQSFAPMDLKAFACRHLRAWVLPFARRVRLPPPPLKNRKALWSIVIRGFFCWETTAR